MFLDVISPMLLGFVMSMAICQPKFGSFPFWVGVVALLFTFVSNIILIKYAPKRLVWNRSKNVDFNDGKVYSSSIDMGRHRVDISRSGDVYWSMNVFYKPPHGDPRLCYSQQLGEWDTATAERLALKAYEKWCEGIV